MEVNVSHPKSGKTTTVNYDFGETLEDSVDLFTAEVVHGVFVQQGVVKVQALVRGMLGKDATQEEIEKRVAEYKIGAVNRVPGGKKGNKEANLLAYLADLPDDKKAEFLAKVKEKLNL